MESTVNGKMSTASTSAADPADARASGLVQAGYSSRSGSKLPTEAPLLHCLSPSVRNFGTAANPSGDSAAFKDCNMLDASLVAKHFYDRTAECFRFDGVSWEDFVKVQRGNGTTARDSSPGTSSSLPSTSGTCKFIKDEREPAASTAAPVAPNFGPPPAALGTCCDAGRKQQPRLGEGESSTSFTATEAAPRSGPESPPDVFSYLTQPDQFVGPVRTDSRCGLSGKAAVNLDANVHPAAQLATYRSEAPRWQTQTSAAESQYWGQSSGASEDPFMAGGFLQNQAPSQRNLSPYSAFPGMPPQRLCVICSDEASGCHYGVLTCGSCKVFFKRAVEGHHSYLCAGRNDCIVDKIRRKNCPACRLRKCYQAGMMLGGRKMKRFVGMKSMDMSPFRMFQSHLEMSGNNQAMTPTPCLPGIHHTQFSQHIITILENIEPEVVHSGHDRYQPDVPHLLLSSLNRLCEKQLLWIVKWSKSLPGFRNLHIDDQMTLIQYSWMNLMVFSLGWRSFQNVTSEYLYFAPDLILSQEQMRRSPIYDLCLAIQFIPQEFANLQVTREEFLYMKAIILLNTVPLEGLKSQAAFEEMRQNYIRELTKAIHMKEKGVMAGSQRFYHLTKLMDAMHDIVKKVNLFCLSTFIQAEAMKVEFPEMMSEVIASQLPKVLAGMVRPLLFHTK
ncbi:progesterone receptor [Pholidichthys leucotaenia]